MRNRIWRKLSPTLPRPHALRGWLCVAIVLSVAATACGDADTEVEVDAMDAESEMAVTPPAEPAEDTVVDVPFEAPRTSDAAVVEGRVIVIQRELNQPLELVLDARGLDQGDHAWDIHSGTCTNAGPVVMALSETEEMEGEVGPLRVDQTGTIELNVELAGFAGLVSSLESYSLHIHAEPGIVHGDTIPEPVTVACAEL